MDIVKIKESTILHYIIRSEPKKDKKPIFVEAINALNPFAKPGYNFVSVSVNEKNLNEFISFVEKGLVEAYFHL